MSASSQTHQRRRLRGLLSVLGLVIVVQGAVLVVREYRSRAGRLTPERAGELGVEPLPAGRHEVVSDYSRIVVEEIGTVRTLFFVADDGRKAVESRMDVARPHRLLVPYTQAMFASYLFVPRQQRVLIVGLGGGSMVRFLEHHDPGLAVEVVEIDAAVVEIARAYFGTRASSTVHILEQDGFDFLKTTETVYDVVYMDAFLEPSEDTDASGTPLRLKTRAFLGSLQGRVHDDGVIVFNVNELEDLEVVREVFAQTYVFGLEAPGVVAVAARSAERVPIEVLRQAAADLDARFRASFSFADMVGRLR